MPRKPAKKPLGRETVTRDELAGELVEYITRRELVIFANAVDARIAQEIAKLTEKFANHQLLISKDVDLTKFQVLDVPEQPPTDSEGAE